MASSTNSGSAAVIWQGFNHVWGYNHRINRIGGYVAHKALAGNSCEADVVHAAASGTGPDTATCTDFYTRVQADGVWFQTGSVEIRLETEEEEPALINELVTVNLNPDLAGKDNYEVFLNGFDLSAEGDADKLNSFSLSVAKFGLDQDRTMLSLLIAGLLIVDCDTPECDWNLMAESANELDRAVSTLETASESRVIEPARDLTAYADVSPLLSDLETRLGDLPAPSVRYTLLVHYVIVAGDAENLQTTQSELLEKNYPWDTLTEIFRSPTGTLSVTVPGDSSRPYGGSTLAFKHFSTVLDRKPGWFKRDKALHLLEWNIAIQDISVGSGGVTAELGLFFKSWSANMIFARIPWSFGALRHAGNARVGARFVLLQFSSVGICQHEHTSNKIEWPGWNRKPQDPAALSVIPVRV